MSYIGNEPRFTQFPSKYFNGDGTAMTVSLDYAPPNKAALLVFISGVRQDTDAYTISGTSLTFTGSVPSGTNNVQVVHLGLTVQVPAPADDTITTAKIQDDAVTTAKIADDNVTTAKILDNNVTLAKLDDGTQGDILYYGASGAPARLGFGTSGDFLKTQGTGANPVWATVTEYDDSGVQDDIALLGFKVASNGSLAKYNLVDQTVDDFQDTSGVDAPTSTNEVRDASGKYYSGQAADVAASSVHTAVGAGTWTCPTGVTSADILVVAGGGGGGGADASSQSGAGGGGGGIVHHATYTTVPAVVYDLTVGNKGTKGGSVSRLGTNGGNSSFNDNAEGSQSKMTAVGGGAGGGGSVVGNNGGSGGGGAMTEAGGSGTQADSSGGTGYGNDGGDGGPGNNGGAATSGGGGGAGGVGAAGAGGGTGGAGGTGQLFSNFTSYGVSGYFGGGGGGGGGGGAGGTAGSGGGGAGGTGGSGMTAGTVNTGGGGGGGGDVSTGADGGTGTVIILYTIPGAVNNMTLVSATTAAQAAPTKGDIVLTYTNGAGTTTLDTDLTAEISADGGSTWTALALGSEGSTGSHNIATAHDVTITSTITSPWNMAYRIKTLNQTSSKTTRIQAVSLGWS